MYIKAEHHGWYLTALFVSLTLLNVFLAEKHKNNPSQALTCHVLAGPPRRAAAAISLSFFHKLLYRPFTCAENIHTSSHAESASSRWKMESTFSPLSAGGGGRASFRSLHDKDFQMFSRLGACSRCVATASTTSWLMSWHRQFSSWNNK